MQPMVFSPSADVFLFVATFILMYLGVTCFILHVLLYHMAALRLYNFVLMFLYRCRGGGEYHRLHVQFRPPDDGPVRPETCRGKKIAVIVRKQKSSVSSWK